MIRSARTDAPHRGWRFAQFTAAALGVVAYANVPLNGYCYDDRLIVEHSKRVSGERPWREIWFSDYWSEARSSSPQRDLLYRPFSVSSFRLIRAVFGPSPGAQHVVNVILHALVSAGVVLLARWVGCSPRSGLLAGSLFAVLPIHTDVVANAVGRCDLLATGGTTLAILWHSQANSSESPRAVVLYRTASAVAAFLAMASKENGVAVIALIPVLDVCRRIPIRASDASGVGGVADARGAVDPKSGSNAWIRGVRSYGGLVLAAGGYFILRYLALDGRMVQDPPISRSVNVLVDAPAWQHALGALQLWGMYWAKTLWPDVLSIAYSIQTIRLATSITGSYVLLGLLMLGVLAFTGGIAFRRGNRTPLLAAICLVIAYFPTANAAVLLQVYFAERIWYGPSIWVALFVAATADAFAPTRLTRVTRAATTIATTLLVGAMIGRCWVRNMDWRDEGLLFAAAVRDQPEGVAALQLHGQYLVNTARFAEATPLLERALSIDPGFTDAYVSLAQAQIGSGRVEDALRTLAIAEQQSPGQPRTQRLIALAQSQLGESATSELARLRAGAEAAPDDLNSQLALVRVLRERGLGREAERRFQILRSTFEASPVWRYEHAVTLATLGERDEAIAEYEGVVAIDDANVQARAELAMLLLERRADGDLARADEALRPAENAVPVGANILAARAEWFAAQGRTPEAIATYRRAISSLPTVSGQRVYFEQRLRALGG